MSAGAGCFFAAGRFFVTVAGRFFVAGGRSIGCHTGPPHDRQPLAAQRHFGHPFFCGSRVSGVSRCVDAAGSAGSSVAGIAAPDATDGCAASPSGSVALTLPDTTHGSASGPSGSSVAGTVPDTTSQAPKVSTHSGESESGTAVGPAGPGTGLLLSGPGCNGVGGNGIPKAPG